MVHAPVARTIGRQRGWLARSAAWLIRSGRPVPWWVVAAAGLSPALLIISWLVADSLQPASYDPARQTISELAGYGATDRWIMTGTLLAISGCYLVVAAGLAYLWWPARVLLIVVAMCAVGIAASPETAGGPTAEHLGWTALGAVTIAIWPAIAGWPGSHGAALLSMRRCALVTAMFVALLGWVVLETQVGSYLGLAERVAASVQVSWPFAVALLARRPAVPEPAGSPRLTARRVAVPGPDRQPCG